MTATFRQRHGRAATYAALAGVTMAAVSLGACVEHSDAGVTPLRAQAATRTVEVRMLDAMKFDPGVVRVASGETVRFVARNTGQLEHELVIGSAQEIQEHAAAMRKGATHGHAGGAAVKVAPGRTGDLIVTFAEPAVLTMACLLPGHFEAGMSGSVQVAAVTNQEGARAPSQAQPAKSDHGTHKH